MIYLDNSATTRPFDEVIETMSQAMRTDFFNPSALYHPAVAAEKAMNGARSDLCAALGCRHIIFTSGGTEADNLAVLGTAATLKGAWDFLFSEAEHPAIWAQKEALEALGHRVLGLPLTPLGLLDLEKAQTLLGPRTALVSLMQVSNETGAIQPLEALSALIRAKAPQALFHVDGVQGFLRLPLSLTKAGIDLYTLSAHKIHGPKGIGCLALGKGLRLSPRILGGGQEGELRGGTENTTAIAGLHRALQTYQALPHPSQRMSGMKMSLYALLAQAIPGLWVNGPPPEGAEAAPHILNLSFPGIRGEVLLHALEAQGVLVGTGSACSSKKQRLPRSFAAMGLPRERAEAALRLSLSPLNTPDEMEEAAGAIIACYRQLIPYQRR